MDGGRAPGVGNLDAMHPAVPDRPAQDGTPGPGSPGLGSPRDAENVYVTADVGSFDQGTEFSRWALARYIVGRVILERVSWALLAMAVVVLALAAVSQWVLHSTLLAV